MCVLLLLKIVNSRSWWCHGPISSFSWEELEVTVLW
jgi:hypothetical protein